MTLAERRRLPSSARDWTRTTVGPGLMMTISDSSTNGVQAIQLTGARWRAR